MAAEQVWFDNTVNNKNPSQTQYEILNCVQHVQLKGFLVDGDIAYRLGDMHQDLTK